MDDTSNGGDGFAQTHGDEGGSALPAGSAAPGNVAPRTGAGRWVESSWDLRRGLTVREGLPTDAGLGEWIEVLIRGPAIRP